MANQQAVELTEPGNGALDDPAAFVAAQFAAVLISPPHVALAIGDDQVDVSSLHSLAQLARIVSAVSYDALRFLPRSPLGARNAELLERGFPKLNFCRRGAFQPNSQRKSSTVDQYHQLRFLAAFGFTDCRASFWAGAKLLSKNASSNFSNLSASIAPSRIRQAFSHTSLSCHCFGLRQLRERETRRVRIARLPHFAQSTECSQNRPDSMTRAHPACLSRR